MNRFGFLSRVAGAATLLATASSMGAESRDDLVDAERAMLAGMTSAAENASFGQQGDDAHVLKINGTIQFRYNAVFGADDGMAPSDKDEFQGGFSNARTQLKFKGSIPEHNFNYFIFGQFSTDGGTFKLLESWVNYKFDENWSLKVGQIRIRNTRENSVSESKMMFPGKSLADHVFRHGRSQGLKLKYQTDAIRARFILSDGRNALNTDFRSETESDFAASSRVEFRLGDATWKQYGDMTSWRGNPTGALIGVAGHWQQEGSTSAAPSTLTGTVNYFGYTADVTLEGDGWHATIALYGQTFDGNGGDSVTDFGATAQGGLFLSEQLELIGRVSVVVPDDDRGSADETFTRYSIGTNYYLIPQSHALKFTLAAIYTADTQSDSSSLVSEKSSIALLEDVEDGQGALVAQFQLLF